MKLLLPLLLLLSLPVRGQVRRIEDYNAIGWYVYEGDHQLGPRWQVHTEAQVRRTQFIADWQQLLLRGGLGYKVLDNLKVSGGYTWFVTHPYGAHPAADQGKFPEHRFYQDVQLRDEVGRLRLNHRLRLEQRYIGVPGASGPLGNEAVWSRQNRIRYQLMGTLPLQGPTLNDGEFYFTAFDEVFLSFGREVDTNVFNQNRLAGGLGFRVSEDFQFEALFLNQIIQQADFDGPSGLPVFEFNNGFRLGLTYNLALIK